MSLFLAAVLWLGLYSEPALALTTSEHALRIEDKREGNLLLGAEHAVLEKGEIYHTILLVWGRLEISGQVDEVVVLSGHVVFHEGARLTKSLVVMGGSFESEPGAEVATEKVIFQAPGPLWRLLRSGGNLWRDNFDWLAKLVAGFSTCFVLWLVGWGLFTVMPGLQKQTEAKLMKEWPQNFVIGFLASIAVPVVGVLLVVSILGILLVPFYLLFLFCASLLSYMAAGLWTGHRLLPPQAGKRIHPLGFLLGLLALQFLWAVPVWWALLPVLLLWTLAWGALVRGLRQLWT